MTYRENPDVLSLASQLTNTRNKLNPGKVLDFLTEKNGELPETPSSELMRENYADYLRYEFSRDEEYDVEWFIATLSLAITAINDSELMQLAGLGELVTEDLKLREKLIQAMG